MVETKELAVVTGLRSFTSARKRRKRVMMSWITCHQRWIKLWNIRGCQLTMSSTLEGCQSFAYDDLQYLNIRIHHLHALSLFWISTVLLFIQLTGNFCSLKVSLTETFKKNATAPTASALSSHGTGLDQVTLAIATYESQLPSSRMYHTNVSSGTSVLADGPQRGDVEQLTT